jgi:FkbM family methyltransferase
MDLGGYKGQWASDIYARYNCRLMIFEPVRLFAEGIERRFKNNSRVEVFNLALGAGRRNEIIAVRDDGSSLYRDSSLKEEILVEDAADFFAQYDIENVDLMKVNIEGGEYELLPRLLQTKLVNRIKSIQIQYHNVAADSESRMNRICEDLTKTHSPTYQYKFVWENWQRHNS